MAARSVRVNGTWPGYCGAGRLSAEKRQMTARRDAAEMDAGDAVRSPDRARIFGADRMTAGYD
ncbi:hypothetical protein Trco_003612 [Trichoderma cornu-damae]|uniref:Uncharacterized protein n=1 Tax=Trichoderma cornu-damae TaxID=654480 RepID=A0A9P8TXG3_9HYPO|nr:hypothetical protein Trco_003612 [Trichoderma cornu-damae]